jgi:4-aminobutyrate aminotransferase-like enzyme
MGSGLPVGAVVGEASVMDRALPGTLGGTYGGNPVACAAALATISVMEEINLNAKAQQIGEQVRQRFSRLKDRCKAVADVRGLGAMIAMEFCHEGDPRRPAPEIVAAALARCREQGVLVLPAGALGNVIRTLSPLVIELADLGHALDVIEEAVLASAGEKAL